MEKQKLVYVLNRDQAANLTISSPLEAHKSHNIVFSVAGLDMGFDNPVFAAIELDYADADQVSAPACAVTARSGLRQECLPLGHLPICLYHTIPDPVLGIAGSHG